MGSMRGAIFNVLHTLRLHDMLRVQRRSEAITVLAFHRVTPEDDPFWLSLTPEKFETILKYCCAHYELVSLHDITGVQQGRKPRMAITFDDGFHDFYDHALPVLEHYDVPANLNVVAGCIERAQQLWTRTLADAFLNFKNEELRTYTFGHKTLNFTGKWLKDFNQTLWLLVNMSPADRSSFFDKVEKDFGPPVSPAFLSWDQLRDISGRNVLIGSHSMSHPIMPRDTDEHNFRELALSKEMLDTKLQQNTSVFAFPNGQYDDRLLKMALDCGYKTLLITDPLKAERMHSVLPRVTIYSESPAECIFRIERLHSLVRP